MLALLISRGCPFHGDPRETHTVHHAPSVGLRGFPAALPLRPRGKEDPHWREEAQLLAVMY